jgi:hypothetical protein
MRVAIVGSGIAGMYVAYRLGKEHDIAVFEGRDCVGGNVRTHPVECARRRYDVDVGASLFHPKTYPIFFGLLKELGVRTKPADLSYAVDDRSSGRRLRGSYQRILLSNPLSFLSPELLRLAPDAWRFYRESRRLLANHDGQHPSLREFLGGRYGKAFTGQLLCPIAMVVWGTTPEDVGDLSARCMAAYLLRIRPGWRIIQGGTSQYIRALTAPFRDRIRLNTPVRSIVRQPDHVVVRTDEGAEPFDAVVVATSADRAIPLLGDPTDDEREVLGAFAYRTIRAVVHSDTSVIDHLRMRRPPSVSVVLGDRFATDGLAAPRRLDITFHLNRMMDCDCSMPLFASVLPIDGIAPDKVIGSLEYRQPVFTPEAVEAQSQWKRINGRRRTFFCGAYWGFGEHEDALESAVAVCRRFDQGLGEDWDAEPALEA